VRSAQGRDDLRTCLLGEFVKAITHDVEANPVIEQSHHRFLVLGHSNGLMQRDRVPDKLCGLFGETMLFKQATSRIGSIYLEALVWTPVMLGEPKIVKHGAHVKQLRIVLLVLLTAQQ
jgi:hypothetical protein